MAYTQNEAGDALLFKFGDGGGPENFTASCSINTSRKLDLSSEIATGQRHNCAVPGAPTMPKRRVKALDIKFTGAGVADMASFRTLRDLWKAGQPFNGKVIQDADNGWTITAPWVIESMSIGGDHAEDQVFDISLSIADEFAWVDN